MNNVPLALSVNDQIADADEEIQKFPEMSIDELTSILDLTIKKDDTNKLLTFLTMLSAFTEDSQLNLSFNAPSSSGKTFIPLEIASLFPKESIIALGSCSPTAFFHENGEYDKATHTVIVDLERKIIIFLDQQNYDLLQKLRPLLSHDQKELVSKITDKSMKGGNRTKTVVLKGFAVVIFCTAGLKVDEQEATRCLILSPEIDEEKIRQGVKVKIQRESNKQLYLDNLDADLPRQNLIKRIAAIKQEHISTLRIGNAELFEQMVFACNPNLKPRMQRDVGKISSLIKSLALFNLWFREREGDDLIANDDDIRTAFAIWKRISESQDLNLSPYVLDLYKKVIVKNFEEKNKDKPKGEVRGLTRSEFRKAHHDLYSRPIESWRLREVISMLETAGLISQEQDENDRRNQLVYPTYFISSKNNSEEEVGVQQIKDILF